MADTQTTNLLLTNMEIGSHDNTWGDVLNANNDLIDAKFGDVTGIVSAGGTSILSDDEERVNLLEVSGTLTSNKILQFTGRGGTWLVENNTTGAFSLTCKMASESGVTVPQGGKALIYCDTVGIRRMISLPVQVVDGGTGVTTAAEQPAALELEGVRLTSVGVSGATASIDLSSFSAAAYRAYRILFELKPSSDGVLLRMRTSTNGGSSYDAGASDYMVGGQQGGALFNDNSHDAIDLIDISAASGNVGNETIEGCWGEILIHRPNDEFYGRVLFHTGFITSSGQIKDSTGAGVRRAVANIDAFRLFFSSGNIGSGAVTVYGLR